MITMWKERQNFISYNIFSLIFFNTFKIILLSRQFLLIYKQQIMENIT